MPRLGFYCTPHARHRMVLSVPTAIIPRAQIDDLRPFETYEHAENPCVPAKTLALFGLCIAATCSPDSASTRNPELHGIRIWRTGRKPERHLPGSPGDACKRRFWSSIRTPWASFFGSMVPHCRVNASSVLG